MSFCEYDFRVSCELAGSLLRVKIGELNCENKEIADGLCVKYCDGEL